MPLRPPSDVRPVLVVGATGRIGRHVVDQLLRAGARVRAFTRRPDAAEFPADVEVIGGDLTDPASLDAAMRGTAAVFLIWTAPITAAPAAINVIASHAPERVVYVNSPHRVAHPFFQQPNALRSVHAEVDRLIAASGLKATALRPGMFASNVRDWWLPQLRNGDVVRWPYRNVETAPIDERDIASVAAHALLDARHVGADYVLTGPEALSHAEQLHAIGEATGRTLRFEELTPDEFRRATAGVWPAAAVDMLLSAWAATLGHPAYVTSTVADVTGTPARTFRDWAKDYASEFR